MADKHELPRADQPTTEIDPKQVVHAYLEQASQNWLTAKASAERAGHMNARLNALEADTLNTVDNLLEELHALGNTALTSTVEQP